MILCEKIDGELIKLEVNKEHLNLAKSEKLSGILKKCFM
jgi:hypothetical protein